jgi:hypothetical protein
MGWVAPAFFYAEIPLSFVDRSVTEAEIGPIPMRDDDSERPHSRESFSTNRSRIVRGRVTGFWYDD